MENLFLEILRVIDYRYHKKNTDFYLFPKEYYKLIINKKTVTEDDLIDIVENIIEGNEYLFLLSKIESNKELFNKLKFDPNNKIFLANRKIIFFICYFLKYLLMLDNNLELDMDIEKSFFGVNNKLVSSFKYILNHSKNNYPLINFYKDIDKFSNENKSVIENIFTNQELRLEKGQFQKNITYYFISNFCYGLKIHLENKDIGNGVKKSFDYNFEVSIFYIIFSLLSNNINEINLANFYSNLN
tara:strand:+ start:223 stop:951 length:729 start_codon:yes stop_codon:yes gene_type:complete